VVVHECDQVKGWLAFAKQVLQIKGVDNIAQPVGPPPVLGFPHDGGDAGIILQQQRRAEVKF
jgi:hypothetical protein